MLVSLSTALTPTSPKPHHPCGDVYFPDDFEMMNKTNRLSGTGNPGEDEFEDAFLENLLGPIPQECTPAANAPTMTQCIPFGQVSSQQNLLEVSQRLNTNMMASYTGNQSSNSLSRFGSVMANASSAVNTSDTELLALFGSANLQQQQQDNLQHGMESSSTRSLCARRLSLQNLTSTMMPQSLSQAGKSMPGGQPSAFTNTQSLADPSDFHTNTAQSLVLAQQNTLRSQKRLHAVLNTSWQQTFVQPSPVQQVQAQAQAQDQSLQMWRLQQQQRQDKLQTLNETPQLPVKGMNSLSAPPQVALPKIQWKGRGRSSTFPLKLHQMLLDLEKQEGGPSIASFLPHGRGFQIHKPKEFAKQVMPHYFRMSTYSSFQRQLNLYDFQRIADGPEKGAYWHECFLREDPLLSSNMKRTTVKTATRARLEERLRNYEQQKAWSQGHTL